MREMCAKLVLKVLNPVQMETRMTASAEFWQRVKRNQNSLTNLLLEINVGVSVWLRKKKRSSEGYTVNLPVRKRTAVESHREIHIVCVPWLQRIVYNECVLSGKTVMQVSMWKLTAKTAPASRDSDITSPDLRQRSVALVAHCQGIFV